MKASRNEGLFTIGEHCGRHRQGATSFCQDGFPHYTKAQALLSVQSFCGQYHANSSTARGSKQHLLNVAITKNNRRKTASGKAKEWAHLGNKDPLKMTGILTKCSAILNISKQQNGSAGSGLLTKEIK
jgi:hypothetical protein